MARMLYTLWVVFHLAVETRTRARSALQTLQRRAGVEHRGLVGTGGDMLAKKFCFRCTTCNVNWPHKVELKACLNCGEECWAKTVQTDDEVVSVEEVESIKRNRAFEEYCDKRDRQSMQADADRMAASELTVADIVGP